MRLSAATTFAILSLVSFLALASSLARARVEPFPPAFKNEMIATNGTKIYVRLGGNGPAMVLLHGYGETGDMWAPLAAKLARDHTVIVPDLRGMGLSERPAGGYDKKTQGQDIAGILDALKIGKVDLVTHDIGNMVGYAFAAQHPDRVGKFVLIDAPLPGVGPWDDIIRNHALWHFSFYGAEAERLVKGRERIYLPKNFDEESREHYAALYARPGAMHAGFEQFKAFDQDAADNKAFVAAGKHAYSGGRRREILRPNDGGGDASSRDQCDGSHRAPFGSLGHGGKSRGYHQARRRFSRSIVAVDFAGRGVVPVPSAAAPSLARISRLKTPRAGRKT